MALPKSEPVVPVFYNIKSTLKNVRKKPFLQAHISVKLLEEYFELKKS